MFKKLLSTVWVIAISCFNFPDEARVTREIAESALPYLMEAAGIPKNLCTSKHQSAIISMIYTDKGQQQMVKWTKIGEFPDNLQKAGFIPVDTYKNKEYREASLASLFPCQTDTFTSFANHKSRLGNHILSEKNNLDVLLNTLLKNKINIYIDPQNIINNINLIIGELPLDILLAKTIFTLDICESPQQINKLLNIKINRIQAKTEYTCRPISAIATLDGKTCEGDCVETLYRHLINIVIQDKDNFSIFHTENLPLDLYKYYDPKCNNEQQKENFIIECISECGLTTISQHTEWKSCLKKVIGENCSSVGSVNNIARGLAAIAGVKEENNDEIL